MSSRGYELRLYVGFGKYNDVFFRGVIRYLVQLRNIKLMPHIIRVCMLAPRRIQFFVLSGFEILPAAARRDVLQRM